MQTVSMSCDTAVEPVARSHNMRPPVARLSAWNTAMSANWEIKYAAIDATRKRCEPANTASYEAARMPCQSGASVSAGHGSLTAMKMMMKVSAAIAKPTTVT